MSTIPPSPTGSNTLLLNLIDTTNLISKPPQTHGVFRIPANTLASELAVDHTHYDTTDANADPNCVFPIDRLHELVTMGVIGAVAPMNFGFMGFIPDGRLLRDTTAPIVANRLLAQSTDAVILTPG